MFTQTWKEANILLVEGIKEGKLDRFKVAPPLIKPLYNMDGEYTAEIRESALWQMNIIFLRIILVKD